MVAISTERTVIRLIQPDDGRLLSEYYQRNQGHLSPWEPPRAEGFHSEVSWQQRARQFSEEVEEGRAIRFVALLKDEKHILAVINFNNIVRGAFQACHLGYSIDAKGQGKGLMFEILTSLIPHVFEHYQLHRIMANYIPSNKRSGQLLERLGFEKEGYAKDYLLIGTDWQDHILTAVINPSYHADV